MSTWQEQTTSSLHSPLFFTQFVLQARRGLLFGHQGEISQGQRAQGLLVGGPWSRVRASFQRISTGLDPVSTRIEACLGPRSGVLSVASENEVPTTAMRRGDVPKFTAWMPKTLDVFGR